MQNNNLELNFLQSFIPYLLALTVYSTELFKHFIFGSNFAIDVYLVAVSLLGIFLIKINKKFLKIYLIIILILLLHLALLVLYNYNLINFTKQAIGIALIYLGLGSLIIRVDKGKLIKAYMNLALVLAYFGLLQWTLSYFEIFDILIKVRGRLDSITYEPSHYAITSAPALFLFIRDFFLNKTMTNFIKMLTIILSYLLTISLTAYIILFLIIILLMKNYKSFLLASIFLLSLSIAYINTLKFDEISQSKNLDVVYKKIQRLTESTSYIYKIDEMESPKNLTVYSLLINFNAAKANLLNKGRILGSGLGSHPQIIEETAPVKFRNTYYYEAQIFNNNGYSLFIKVISEFGLFGIFFYILFVIKGISRNSLSISINDTWWLVGSIHLMALMFKTTSFVDNGTPIFLLAPLLINNKIFKNEK